MYKLYYEINKYLTNTHFFLNDKIVYIYIMKNVASGKNKIVSIHNKKFIKLQ